MLINMTGDSVLEQIKIHGIILARKNSKGIRNKNLSSINGTPLIVLAIRAMKQCNCFTNVWVSTDDDVISVLANKEGASVHRRAAYTATDEAPSLIALQEFLQYHDEIRSVCLVQCTSPFVSEKYLKKGWELFMNSKWDSIFSVTRRYFLRWSEDTPSTPLNFDIKNRPRRQAMSGDLCENGMFYFCHRKFAMEGLLQGGRCNYVEIPEEDSLDIDTPMDLFLAQHILKLNKDERLFCSS